MDTDYAEFPLSLSRANIGQYPVFSSARGGSLKERVRAILEKKEVIKKMSKRIMASLLVAILSVVFIVSMARLVDTVSIGNTPMAKVVFSSAPPPPAGEL